MNSMYCFVYKRMDMQGRIHLLVTAELYEYHYVHVCMFMFRRVDRPGRMRLRRFNGTI